MASKYLMGDLRMKLVRIVEQEWPLRLRDMEQRDGTLEKVFDNDSFIDTEWPTHLIPESCCCHRTR